MKKLYIIGLLLSTGAGMWHFTVPYLYKWYSYIPDAPKQIIRSIDWINYFFSLLLTGLSVILITFVNKIFEKNKEIILFYGYYYSIKPNKY